jgi:hypothetical protein
VRRFLAAVLAVILLAVGYLALDVADVVPGILTRDELGCSSCLDCVC